jgi:hypothetical protein
MLANLLAKRNFFVQILLITLFFGLGASNFNSIYLNKLEIIGLGLSILTILYVWYVDYQNSLVSSSSYTTWFYMLWIMPCLALLLDFRVSGSLLLVTYIITKLIYFEVDNTVKYEAFDIGAFLGFAILLNPPLFILGLVILGYFISLRSIDSSIFTLAILGLLVPILVFVQVSYLLDFDFLIDYYHDALLLDYFRLDIKQIFLVPVVIFIVVSFLDYVKNVNKEPVHIKRIFLLLFLIVIALTITSALFGGAQLAFLSFFGFIFMILFSKYFSNKKPQLNWLKETILWGYLICMLFYNFYDRIPRIYSLITDVSF